MDHDRVERVFAIARALNHLLENGSTIINGGHAGFDEFENHFVAVVAAPRLQLRLLVWN